MAARDLVEHEDRRRGERRAFPDDEPPTTGRGELVHRGNRAHVEIELIENQCAQEAALERLSHAAVAAHLLLNELRNARAASVAARRAARTATSIITGFSGGSS